MPNYILNQRQLDMVASCIARANVEGAFAGCVVPSIGESVGNMLEQVRAKPIASAATLKLWTLTIDSDDGTITTVSADHAELAARAESVVFDEWSTDEGLGPMPEDWRDAYQVLRDRSWDTYLTILPHDVTLPAQEEDQAGSPAWDTQVRLIIGASAYAVITECGGQFDVRLTPGRRASTALREYASEQRARAACIIESAERAERAAIVLDQPKTDKES